MNRAGIRWALLRGEAELHDPGGDVDLLVDSHDAAFLDRTLLRAEFLPVPTHIGGSHAFFVGYSEPDDRWIRLDVVTSLCFGPRFSLQTNAAEACLARRQITGELHQLALDDRFWALMLHCLLDKGRFEAHRADALRHLALDAGARGPLSCVAAQLCPPGWSEERILECARCGEFAELECLASRMISTLPGEPASASMRHTLTRRGKDLASRIRFRLRYTGVSVAVMGPDGAGKSTLACGIADSFYFPTRVVYMGLWSRVDGPPPLPIPGLRVGTQLLRLWRRFLVAQWHRSLGRLVIFDRYTYDVLVPTWSRWSRRGLVDWLLGHACPSPDLVLVLDVPGEVMFERKREHSPSELDKHRKRLLALSKMVPNVEVLDALLPVEQVRREAMSRVWRCYVEQWSHTS